MSFRSVSVLSAAVLTLSLGSAVALTNTNPFFSNIVAQKTMGEGFERKETELLQELNLTPEQTQKIETIQNQYRNQSQDKQAVRQAHQELFNLMAGTAPESEIRAKQSQVAALMQQAYEAQFNKMLAIREVLTPEQRSQLAERMKSRFEDFKNHRMNRSGPQG